MDAVKYVSWCVGSKLDLIIISKMPENHFIAVHCEPTLNIINDELLKQLCQYAGTFSSDYKYQPVVDEVVVARYKGK